MSENQPLVSVILPVYNGEKYIAEALNSIVNQSYKNLEILVINDGSTDHTESIIKSIADQRIRLINNIENKGLVFSLNKGIELSSGKYIARMDADDIAMSERIELQLQKFEGNKDLIICGTGINFFGSLNFKRPTIKNFLITLIDSHFAHPSVMIEKSLLIKSNLKYDTNVKLYFEDYVLWNEILKYHNYRLNCFENIDISLLNYRTHESQFSLTTKAKANPSIIYYRRKFTQDFFKFYNLSIDFEQKSAFEILKNVEKNKEAIFNTLNKHYPSNDVSEFYYYLIHKLLMSLEKFSISSLIKITKYLISGNFSLEQNRKLILKQSYLRSYLNYF